MTCDEADELIGAWAVDALATAESRAFEAHLGACQRHAEEASALRATAARLPDATQPLPPPSALRSKVLAAIDATAPTMQRTPGRAFHGGSAGRWRRANAWQWTVAAAAVVAIVALGAWNIALQRGGRAGVGHLATGAQVFASASGGGVVLYFPDERQALVVGEAMKPLDPAKQTYQVWQMDGSTARSVGHMQADAAGHALAVVPFDIARGHTLAITIEPRGGSIQPTGAPVFTARG